jgi:hypothetical protein
VYRYCTVLIHVLQWMEGTNLDTNLY